MIDSLVHLGYAAVALMIAGLAHDLGKRFLADRAAKRAEEFDLARLHTRVEVLDEMIPKLATDWKREFMRLENEWKSLEKRAQSLYSGATAQVEAQATGRGFNRSHG